MAYIENGKKKSVAFCSWKLINMQLSFEHEVEVPVRLGRGGLELSLIGLEVVAGPVGAGSCALLIVQRNSFFPRIEVEKRG